MSTVTTTIGTDPARIDIEVTPGETVDFTVPVYDAAGSPLDVSSWTLAGTVRLDDGSPVLFTFTTAGVAPTAGNDGGVNIAATGAETTGWTNWSVTSAPWSLWFTPTADPAYLFATGWVRVR